MEVRKLFILNLLENGLSLYLNLLINIFVFSLIFFDFFIFLDGKIENFTLFFRKNGATENEKNFEPKISEIFLFILRFFTKRRILL